MADFEIPRALRDISEDVTDTNRYDIEVIDLLNIFNQQKRGARVIERINRAIDELGLKTVPSLERADYYGQIEIVSKSDISEDSAFDEFGWPVSAVKEEAGELFFLNGNDKMSLAITEMISRDFSQVPIFDGSKPIREKYLGSVTWETLAQAVLRYDEVEDGKCKDYATHANDVMPTSTDILDAVARITESSYVYLVNDENEIVDIVTSSDVSQAFTENTGVFLKVSELESKLKSVIASRAKIEEYRSLLLNGDRVEDVSDLTFGDIVQIFRSRDMWKKLGVLSLDRNRFSAILEEVRKIRNNTMHFRSAEGDSYGNSEDLATVKSAIRLVEYL
jgi:hypothetical protein